MPDQGRLSGLQVPCRWLVSATNIAGLSLLTPSIEVLPMNDNVNTDTLFEQLQTVIRDSEELLKASAAFAGDKIEQARMRAKESLRSAKERLAGLGDDVVSQTQDFVGKGNHYVRDNPWQAIGFAAAIGFVLGALLTRGSRDG
jgi:ElaB/YqjD/DUF883 family membrane-anchored ribosome-binding protein